MDNARTNINLAGNVVADFFTVRIFREKPIDNGVLLGTGAGMHADAGWLVDDDDVFVFEEDRDVYGGDRGGVGSGIGEVNSDGLAFLQDGAGFNNLAVDADIASFDGFLDGGTGELGQFTYAKYVQSLADGGRFDDKTVVHSSYQYAFIAEKANGMDEIWAWV